MKPFLDENIIKKTEIIFCLTKNVPLMVKCKDCSADFISKYQMSNTSAWHKPNSSISLQQICPACGKTDVYTKEDHFFQ